VNPKGLGEFISSLFQDPGPANLHGVAFSRDSATLANAPATVTPSTGATAD